MAKLKFPSKLEPFKGVILFAVVLILSNFFWKYNVTGDEATNIDSTVTFWGLDISAPFIFMAHHVTHVSYTVLHFLGKDITQKSVNFLQYPNGNSVQIMWACTGIKQAYIYFCILAFSRGSWLKKLWYIPLGLFVVYAFNIFRITCIAASVENYPDWFDFLHFYFLKYLFYGIIFGMWVFWEEKVIIKEKTEKQTKATEKDIPT